MQFHNPKECSVATMQKEEKGGEQWYFKLKWFYVFSPLNT